MKLERLAMGRMVRRPLAISAGLLAVCAGMCFAEPPAVLDRVPGDAALVIMLRNIDQTQTKMMDVAKYLGQEDAMGDGPMAEIEKISKTPGLNKNGSLALAIMGNADGVNFDDEQGPVIIIAPVSDYAAFVKGLGGEAGAGISEVKFDEQAGFVKDIGGGFAAMSPKKELLEAFAGKAGAGAGHAKSFGKTGVAIADRADLLFITNVPMLQKQIDAGMEQFQEQAKGATAMMGQQAAQAEMGLAFAQTVMKNWSRDAERAIVGLSKTDKGIAIDLASHFKDGSELAKFFQASGKSGALLSRVPNQPFLFAGSADFSSPGIKQIGKNMADYAAQQAKAGGQGEMPMGQMLKSIDTTSGIAFCVGANPAAMMGGGVFTNTTYYIATSDPKGYLSAAKSTILEANGKKQGPVTTKSTYESDAQDIKGVKADKWSSKIEVDPNDPSAMQVQMVTGMLFGPAGMGGYSAATNDGVVSVMSPNTPLMEMALDSAKSGKGLGDEPSIKGLQGDLPGSRFFELYVGSKSIFDSIGGIMAMMGGGAPFKVPDQLTPLAIVGTSDAGGMGVHIFVPSDVIQAVSEMSKSMKQGEDEDMDAPKDEKSGKAPRF